MSSGQGKLPFEVVTDNALLRNKYEDQEFGGLTPLMVTTTSAQGVEKLLVGERLAELPLPETIQAAAVRFGVRTQTATIKNPLPLAVANEPVAIRISFPRGAVAGADYLRVNNQAGAYVAFQWEPETDPRTDADISTWPDGSLRAGTIWVLATLTASESQIWQIEQYQTAQSNSFATAVAFAVVDGTTEKLTAGGMDYRFTSDNAWLCAALVYNSTGFDYYATGGEVSTFWVGATTYASSTPANVSLVSHGDVTPGANKGVVFRDFQTVFTWVIDANAQAVITKRVFANGTSRNFWRWNALGTISTSPTTRRFVAALTLSQSATTSAPLDTDLMYMSRFYTSGGGRAVAIGISAVQATSEAQPNEGPFDRSFGTQDYRQLIGWESKASTTSLVAGANCRVWQWIAPEIGASAVIGDVVNRMQNPIYCHAEPASRYDMRRTINAICSEMLGKYISYGASGLENNTNRASSGVDYLFDYVRNGTPASLATAKSRLAEWLAYHNNTGLSADVSYNNWLTTANSKSGLEYMGLEGMLPFALYLLSGDKSQAALIHALADFAIKAEAWSKSPAGGNMTPGNVYLYPGGGSPYNGAASALSLICQSLYVDPGNADRLAIANEIMGYINAGWKFVNKFPYGPDVAGIQTGVIFGQRRAYYTRAVWDIMYSQRLAPAITRLAADPVLFLSESYNAVGQADENRWSSQKDRRGLVGGDAVGICIFEGSERAYATGLAVAAHSAESCTPRRGFVWPLDGWQNPADQAQSLNQWCQRALMALALTQ